MTEPSTDTVDLEADTAAPETDAAAPLADDAPETFSADYVRELREESAAHRVKAKKVDDANARLVSAYVAADGRLVDPDAIAYADELVGDDGLVDREKVSAAIASLVEAKPYLASRKPTAPLPQGVREDVPTMPGLFDFIRERA